MAIPELDRPAKKRDPFFLFLRHMDPHASYLPPYPYERFYHGDELDPENKSMKAGDEFRSPSATSSPPDAARHHRQRLRHRPVRRRDVATGRQRSARSSRRWGLRLSKTPSSSSMAITARRSTITNAGSITTACVRADAGGAVDHSLPGQDARREACAASISTGDLVPTLLELAELQHDDLTFDGRSLMTVRGEEASHESEFDITECMWMRKYGLAHAAVEADHR
ncbi:MAG: hypothetical protein R2856_32325 [Caldilineaceae bacterium]